VGKVICGVVGNSSWGGGFFEALWDFPDDEGDENFIEDMLLSVSLKISWMLPSIKQFVDISNENWGLQSIGGKQLMSLFWERETKWIPKEHRRLVTIGIVELQPIQGISTWARSIMKCEEQV
jgi:hypothetical protein